jgi:hypothetical protein
MLDHFLNRAAAHPGRSNLIISAFLLLFWLAVGLLLVDSLHAWPAPNSECILYDSVQVSPDSLFYVSLWSDSCCTVQLYTGTHAGLTSQGTFVITGGGTPACQEQIKRLRSGDHWSPQGVCGVTYQSQEKP